jgi:putative Flp pilus-assembly TadE/G-like protein
MRFTEPSTRTRSRKATLQGGQAIVLIALLILVLFGMLGLAVDSGRGYVDRRDQQTAVDAAALAAGDWWENFQDLNGTVIPQSLALYQSDLRLYTGPTSQTHTSTLVGPQANLPQDTYTYTFNGGYSLVIVATNTQFNGYEFQFTSSHALPLAFMQIFGGGLTIPIGATATSIVGNQRQTPALLTLSTDKCASDLTGSAQLTVLGDVYTNGTACLDDNLHEAGNCYGAAGSNCSDAQYFCYNSTPGFVPYPPPCLPGDITGTAVVPAPTLPDPGYLAPSVGYYAIPQAYNLDNRGTWTEMYPGQYASFHLSGGTASCAFLNGGVYNWTSGYTSDANGSLLSNELKAPDEEYSGAPATTQVADPQFWDQNGAGCAGHFNVVNGAAQTVTLGPTCTNLSPVTPAVCHSGVSDTLSRNNRWGVEITSVRYDRFLDPTITPNPCYTAPGCRRESAPSACKLTPNVVGGGLHSPSNIGITINVTQNAPGAQYYLVYLNPYGCDGNPNHFGFVGRYDAPGFINGVPQGTYPSGSNWALGAVSAGAAPAAGASVYDVNDTMIPNPATQCFAQVRTLGCATPDDETDPQCFSNCPPPNNLLSQENAPMSLEYSPYTGGDVANENYCQVSPNPGNPIAPCENTTVTPGAVQFYFPDGSCMTQNSQGATYVFAGEQYNWIVIYAPATNTCSNTMNGGASTQYIGTIYTPGQNWTINGGNRSPLAGQVICYTAKVAGSAAVGIDFNPNYAPAPPAARLIN